MTLLKTFTTQLHPSQRVLDSGHTQRTWISIFSCDSRTGVFPKTSECVGFCVVLSRIHSEIVFLTDVERRRRKLYTLVCLFLHSVSAGAKCWFTIYTKTYTGFRTWLCSVFSIFLSVNKPSSSHWSSTEAFQTTRRDCDLVVCGECLMVTVGLRDDEKHNWCSLNCYSVKLWCSTHLLVREEDVQTIISRTDPLTRQQKCDVKCKVS